ncbi:MAG: purine-binding chemotaxis protein CheW [Deferribacterales bacterium]|nr:purine-binding chemotaxis protein CheW [Deferribacterales bacterium]
MAELKQFVGFVLGKEHYGIDIMIVEEIIRIVDITPVPRAPSFVEGIINMRGRVIPIVDLRKKLCISNDTQCNDSTRIIVTCIDNKRMGFIVDSVEEVIKISSDNIDKAPGTSRAIDNYISGVARTVEKGMVIILDIRKIFSPQEQMALDSIR